MTIDIHPNEQQFIKKTLTTLLPNATYYVFGSRAKGTAKKYSDLDLAIISTEKIPLTTLSYLDEAFTESDLPFKVDIVDWHRIAPDFQAKIKSEWIRL